MTPEQFHIFADPLPEPMLLLTGSGLILAGNRAVENRLGLVLREVRGKKLPDVVSDSPDEIAQYLRSCSRSRSMVLGALDLLNQRGERVPCRAEGTVLRPHDSGREAILLLRLHPKESSVGKFIALNQRIEELDREIQRRKQVEEEAREYSERLRVTLNSIGDGVITTDPAGMVVMMNPVAEHLTGWKQEEAMGLPLESVFHIVNESSRHAVENPALRALREGVIVGLANHTVLLARDGTERPIDDSAAPIRHAQGLIIGSVLVFRDVSGRRQAEEQLRQSEQRFSRFMHHLPGLAWIKDVAGRYVYVNDAAEKAFRTPRADLYGKTDDQIFPPDVAARFSQNDRQAIASGSGIQVIETLEQEDGTLHYSLVTKFPFQGPEGDIAFVGGMAIDITEQRRAEVALRESEEKLRLLADTIPQLAWMARPDGHIFWYNRRWYEYTGRSPEEMEGWGWKSVHDPKVLPSVLEGWTASINSGEPFDMVFPLKGADHQFRPFLTRVNPLKDKDGRILYWFGTNTDISEMKRMEQALRESEERLRQALDAGRMGVWDWNIRTGELNWSANLEPLHGLAPGTFAGTFEHFHSLIYQDDRKAVDSAIRQALETGNEFYVEYRNVWENGGIHWIAGSGRVFVGDDGKPLRMIGVGMDVTQRRRAEQTSRFLADASAALAVLVDFDSTLQKVASLAVPYFADWVSVDVLEQNGNLRRVAVAHVDPAKVQLAHDLHRRYPPDPSKPQGVWNILRTSQPEIIPVITDEMLVESVREEELLGIIRELGLKSYIGVPLTIRGKTLGVLTFIVAESGHIYDETDLAVANDLASRAAIAIENSQLYRELRDADRRKDEFLATLAHELRNPLAPIRNALQILKLPRVDAETAAKTREMMERQVHHLVRLVDDLLDVSRVMQGKIELRREPIELATLVARAVETIQPLIEVQGHQLEISLPPDPLLLNADPVRLSQVVGNLLTNSAKYTEANGQIWLSASRAGDHAVLSIRDNGIGIAADILPHVFELFVQADHASSKAQGGLGIGLTLVKNLVEMHQGTVEARSDGLGKGSEFTVRIPLVTPHPRQPGGELTVKLDQSRQLSGHRILVVDDNQDAAISLAMLLELHGHEVQVAHDGISALDLATTYRPSVIFLDIGMPGLDGYEVARRIRNTPGLEKTILAAVTGWGQQEDRRRTAEAGFDHHLVKPVAADELRKLLIPSKA